MTELERAAALSPDDTAWLAQLGQAYVHTGLGAHDLAIVSNPRTSVRRIH